MPTPPSLAAADKSALKSGQQLNNRRSSWVLIFSFALALALLYLALRGINWSTFWNTLKNGHYEFLLLTIPIASINYFVRALRWSILVRAEKKVPLLCVFWANMVGYMGNAYLPARAGELLRSAILGRKSGAGTSFILATALSERILDAGALVLIGSLALLWQGQVNPALANAVKVVALISALGLVVIIVTPFQEKLILLILSKLPLTEKISAKVSDQVSRFLTGMRSLRNLRRLLTFILLTAIIWLIDGIAFAIGARIVSQNLNIGQALILLAALGLSSAIPSTPGYVGVYQFVAVTVLVPFGFSRSDALAYILISQVIIYFLVSFWGLLGLWQVNQNQ